MPRPERAQSTESSMIDKRPRAKTIILIGCGPKSVAIAAKRHALMELGLLMPELVVIDKSGVASHWLGKKGFTDGLQLLGTSPEKDVGFPYSSTFWKRKSRRVNEIMMRFSWQCYLAEHSSYSRWVDRGRPPPTHREWGQYLQWVARKAELKPLIATVRKIDINKEGQFEVTC